MILSNVDKRPAFLYIRRFWLYHVSLYKMSEIVRLFLGSRKKQAYLAFLKTSIGCHFGTALMVHQISTEKLG